MKNQSPARVYVVIPCYNEEEALPITAKTLQKFFDEMIADSLFASDSRMLLVDDGSKDKTWAVIESLVSASDKFEGLKLAHNAGHQNALWAGMNAAYENADAVISIDADLQDDINAMRGFMKEFYDGADIVYGVRSKRETDTFFKRMTAEMFYKGMAHLGVETVFNHADYRLISKRALKELLSFSEVNLFLRGMVPTLGYKTAKVYYERSERTAGESKYPLKKMLAFAVQGVTSFSVKPIRMIALLGFIFAFAAVGIGLYALISLIAGKAVPGWTSTMLSIWLIGGVQLIALGLIGEYIGKIYTEVKRRPRFIVEEHSTHK
ncbi:MAG: glycosyltransferase family 2 protein [Clostridia bacterium]|nr:glycosyltransferase family 2 protein [Clostridia bacterium]